MAFFDCGFAGAKRDIIQICADLGGGWRELSKGWGFYAEDYLGYRAETKFHCKLYVLAKAPNSWESRKTFSKRYLPESLKLGNSSVSLHGTKLEVDVPLAQRWLPTSDSNRRPSIYEMAEDIFSSKTDDGHINYRLQLWVVLHVPPRMFVQDQREWGDGFAWVGGRPESNRKKF